MSLLMRFPHLHHLTWAALLPRIENWRRVAVALFACLALLAIWQIDTLREAALQPLGGFALGVILGCTTGVAFVVRQRKRR
jgi:hypothetical protein